MLFYKNLLFELYAFENLKPGRYATKRQVLPEGFYRNQIYEASD